MKQYKPTTPTLRHRLLTDHKHLKESDHPNIKLKVLPKHAGRNHHGHITVRRRGGGIKRRYRVIDWKRLDDNCKVIQFEYDPNRTGNIALIKTNEGKYKYILAADQVNIDDILEYNSNNPYKIGNTMKLTNIPLGVDIHNVELIPGKGGKLIRAAGTSGIILSKDDKKVIIKLPSGEHRIINKDCIATIGKVSNPDHRHESIGGAGYNRKRGIRPHVRGVAMNPIDHPHGGGEGKSSGGRPSVTPWGRLTKGQKTTKKSKWVVKSR